MIRESVLREQNNLPHLFNQAQERITTFWKALWDQYISSLRFSSDRVGNKFKRKPKVGDICILWQDDPRKKWKKGIILELIKSKDNEIRQCKVKVGSKVTTRAVNQLYYLEVTAEEFAEEYKRSNDTDKADKVVKKQPLIAKDRPPRRAAAITAMNRNRNLLLEEYEFQ